MSNVLITGGAGFIGSHLTRALLAAGHHVRILDCLSAQIHGEVPTGLDWLVDDSIEFIRGSVTDEVSVRKALVGIDVLVHLAAETGTGQSMYEVARYNNVNVGGTALLLDVLANDSQRSVKRIVLASSRSIYGEGAYICRHCENGQRIYPIGRSLQQLISHQWEHLCPNCGSPLESVATHENDPAKSSSIYAATKYAQEDLVRIASVALGLDYAILRLQNVYGEGQSLNNPYTGILSIFSTRIRQGQYLPIFEDGLETRDFVHVEDVANAFLAAIKHSEYISDVINVGLGRKTTVRDIADNLSRSLGFEPNIVTTKEYRLGDIRHNFADTDRLIKILKFQPTINIYNGINRFADWVKLQPLPVDMLDKANAELRNKKLMG